MNNAPHIDTDQLDWNLIGAAWIAAAVILTAIFGVWSLLG